MLYVGFELPTGGCEESYPQTLAWSRQHAPLLATCFLLGLFCDPDDGGGTCSSETLVDFQQITWYYNHEDRTCQNIVCLKYALTVVTFMSSNQNWRDEYKHNNLPDRFSPVASSSGCWSGNMIVRIISSFRSDNPPTSFQDTFGILGASIASE
jgi:hypothetical protein